MSRGLPSICGHDEIRSSLLRAYREHELPGSLLVHGPTGVGKQRLGLWIAQLLVCSTVPVPADGPCGSCTACRLALRVEHPDIHWFFPLPRPKGVSGPEKLADALEEARAVELEARRGDPLRIPTPGEPVGIFLAQVQTIRRIATGRPAMGRRMVFLIGDAEHLVPQEASPEAANALLKLLEEPPAEATFILTASRPETLLPTLRSRLLPVRLRPLPEELVTRFLADHRDIDDARAATIARIAQGSIGRAIGYLPVAGETGPMEAIRARARELLAAAIDPSPVRRLAAAHALPPTGARGGFLDLLEAIGIWLRDLAALANGADELLVNADGRAFLAETTRRLPAAAVAVPDALVTVEEARNLAQGNVNPQLTLAWLLETLHRTLHPRS